MDGSLGRSTARNQDLSIWPLFFRWPQQKGHRPTPIRVPIERTVLIQVADRRWIRVALVKRAHRVGWIGGHRWSRLFPSHMRLSVPFYQPLLRAELSADRRTRSAPANPVRLGYECLLSCNLRSTSSRLKLAAFWRWG